MKYGPTRSSCSCPKSACPDCLLPALGIDSENTSPQTLLDLLSVFGQRHFTGKFPIRTEQFGGREPLEWAAMLDFPDDTAALTATYSGGL